MSTREDDIKTVCTAVLEYFEQDNSDGWDYCRFCLGTQTGWHGEYVHSVNCPVLVAKDLLS